MPINEAKCYVIHMVPLTCYNLRDYDNMQDLEVISVKFRDKKDEDTHYLAIYDHINCAGNYFNISKNNECSQDLAKCGFTTKSKSVIAYNPVDFNG